MQKSQNFQDAFLSAARREKAPLTLFLMNGFQLKAQSGALIILPCWWTARGGSR